MGTMRANLDNVAQGTDLEAGENKERWKELMEAIKTLKEL